AAPDVRHQWESAVALARYRRVVGLVGANLGRSHLCAGRSDARRPDLLRLLLWAVHRLLVRVRPVATARRAGYTGRRPDDDSARAGDARPAGHRALLHPDLCLAPRRGGRD